MNARVVFHHLYKMKPEEIKNWDKVPEDLKDTVRWWSKITTVTINDDGLFMLDLIPYPGFSEAVIPKD